MRILKSKSLYYDNVNLIASYQENIKSRKDIPEEKWRIFVSPMPSIVGELFALKALDLGLTVGLHRFLGYKSQIKIFEKSNHNNRLYCSVGLYDDEGVINLYRAGVKNIIIDVANGYLKDVIDFTHDIHNEGLFENIVVGNVHSDEGVFSYRDIKNCLIRVGIGGGAMCLTTKSATGFGRGHITEISECSFEAEKSKNNTQIIADGGIRNAADASKAFGAGADYIMLGSYFANALEAENILQKEFKHWGCASDYNQKKYGEKRRHAEGKVINISENDIHPLEFLVNELWGGISSAVSYSGHKSLEKFIGNGQFEIKHT